MVRPQQFPKLGVSACVWKGDRLLVIQRAKPPMAGIWSLPGGHVEPGETALEAAHRELREETCVEAQLDHLVGLYDLIERDAAGNVAVHYAIAVYTGLWLAGEARAASDAATVRWALPGSVGGMAFSPDVPEAIERARALLGL